MVWCWNSWNRLLRFCPFGILFFYKNFASAHLNGTKCRIMLKMNKIRNVVKYPKMTLKQISFLNFLLIKQTKSKADLQIWVLAWEHLRIRFLRFCSFEIFSFDKKIYACCLKWIHKKSNIQNPQLNFRINIYLNIILIKSYFNSILIDSFIA